MYNEEKVLEFDKIKEMWAEYAFTEAAKKQIFEMQPFLSETELFLALRQTTESRTMIERCGNPPIAAPSGILELLDIAGRGDCFTAAQLMEIENALVAVRRFQDYLNKGKQYEISLAYYEENLQPIEELRSAINTQIINGYVSDYATKLLKSLRNDIAYAEEKMREKADGVIRANKEYMSDSFSTVRNGHVCIPVKKEYKFKIEGSVIDKSSTGNTLFVEPAVSARYYEELQELKLEEENEVRRILYELTAAVAENEEVLRKNIRTIEKLDFIFSKGKLSFSYSGVEPEITQDRKICLTAARHPLLNKNTCVPLQFSIGNGTNGIVITGPNTGGKTVAVKTVALCCMMAQCGLHVPCEEAVLCMNSNFLCDIGDGQNLSENLSTFSAHITNVLEILKRVNEESLVVMDELGSGTDPLEGMGLAVAILEELKKSGALFLVTTHYPEVKVYAESKEGIVNARMTFDRENLKPLYQLVIGEAGESCAFYIAKRLGMPSRMLRRAALAAYGENGLGEAQREDLQCLDVCSVSEEITREERESFTDLTPITRRQEPRIVRKKEIKSRKEIDFHRGDSVMVYPDKKIGIICREANEKGALQVQLPGKKIWINHKRVKLLVAAKELYPEDYDFSIIFDTVENRKLRHQMERKYVEGAKITSEE